MANMPVKIKSDGTMRNCQIALGDIDITRFVRSFKVSGSVNTFNALTLEIVPLDGFEIELPAELIAEWYELKSNG